MLFSIETKLSSINNNSLLFPSLQCNRFFEISQSFFIGFIVTTLSQQFLAPVFWKKSITPMFKKKLSFNLRWCQVAVPGGVTFLCIQYPLHYPLHPSHSPNQYPIERFKMVISIREFSLGYLCNFIVIRGNRGIYGVRFLYLFNYSFSFLSASRVSRNKCF